MNITMNEFYEKTGIEVHFIATELNKFCVVDFSYKTHPNQSLIEACYMSCSYPFGFTPIYRDGCCYLDGGIINDYPVTECIRNQKCNISEILGVKMLWESKPANINEKSSVLQFVSTFFNQIKSHLFENRFTPAIPNEVVCISKVFSLQDWMNWVKDENYRRELVLRGETFANVFLSYRRNFIESHYNQQSQQSQHSPLSEVETTTAVQNVILDTTTASASASATASASDIIHTNDEYDINKADTTADHDIIVSTPNTNSFELHNNDDTTMV
jgi:predicted acylesterase/phospholipase RssA